MKTGLNHVAVLVESIEKYIEQNKVPDAQLNEIEEFPGEGTRELYIGKGPMGRLLLMQAIGPGPYQRAFESRGPGLHHIALDVEVLDGFVDQLSGWYIHPSSLKSYVKSRTIFVCRPGTPLLIEVHERNLFDEDEYHIHRVEFPFVESQRLESLRCTRLADGAKIRILDSASNELCRV